MNVVRPKQVWSTDISYIRLARDFAHLTAVIYWYSRKVLAWRSSNTLDSDFCIDCLDSRYGFGTSDIFSSDQGCQFTSDTFTGVPKSHDIAISMDGRGRTLDNFFVERLWRSVKHEEVCLKGTSAYSDYSWALQSISSFTTRSGPTNRWATALQSRSTTRPPAAEQES